MFHKDYSPPMVSGLFRQRPSNSAEFRRIPPNSEKTAHFGQRFGQRFGQDFLGVETQFGR